MPIPKGVRGEDKNYTIMKRQLFTFLLAIVASIGLTNATIYSGTCGAEGDGSNLTWSLNTNSSTLVISGTGEMANWSRSNQSPWAGYSNVYVAHIIIGDSVTNIGNFAFSESYNLTTLTIPNSVTSIGKDAFYMCIGLLSITIPNSVTTIGQEAFAYCRNLTSVIIPNSVTSIGRYAFTGCSNLFSVTIPNSVDSIGDNAFNEGVINVIYSGTALGSPWGARAVNGFIDGGLVYNDESKTQLLACFPNVTGEIIIPSSVTSIGEKAFYECSGLTSVTIGNNVTTIGDDAFFKCSNLTSIIIPNRVSSIGREAFYNCSKLTSVTIGNNVTSIGYEAFYGCSNLTSVIIPNSVTSIGREAFYRCSNLSSVTIGENVTSIGINAFYGCSSLTSVTCYAVTPPQDGAYCGITNTNCTLRIPATAVETYSATNWWKDFKEIIAIPAHMLVVTFKDWDGTVLSSAEVEEGSVATPPTDPTREGYTFTGWDQDFSNITEDLVVTAQYKINRYYVQFLDWDNSVLKADSVNWNTAATAPADPTRKGYDFVGWDKSFDHVTANITVTALYKEWESIQYHLTFVYNEDEIFDQVITVKVPTAPTIPGFTFVKWQIAEKDFAESIIVEAIYSYNGDDTSAPVVAVNPANPTQKLIRDGNVYILHDGNTYTIQGQKVR